MILSTLCKTYFENTHFIVNHTNECPVPGYFIVAIKDSITTLSALDNARYIEFMLLVKHTYTIVEQIIKPEKIYTCLLGELQPKLHIHVFPRTSALTNQYLIDNQLNPTDGIDGLRLLQWAKKHYHNALSEEQQLHLVQQFDPAFAHLTLRESLSASA